MSGRRKSGGFNIAEHELAYASATGRSTRARSVKSQVYGVDKAPEVRAERTASAPALPERIGADADASRLVPQTAQVERPINNMGENLWDAETVENEARWSSISEEDLGEVSLVMTDSGKTKMVMVRTPSATQACIVDWCNFTVLEDTFFKTARQTLVTDDQIIEEASRQYEKIFGFGITDKRDRGMNFYRESWVLGLLVQVDASAGDVLVRGVLYEVQTSKKDGSAFGLALNLLGGKLGITVGAVASPGDLFVSFKNKSIDAVLSVLATDSRFKAVSKPMLRVSSGGSGRFTVGQDVPVLGAVSYPGNGQPAVQSVTYQSSGVIYDVHPVVHDDAIDVSVMQQVSNFVATSTGVSGSPTLIKRELKSDLSLMDGEIVVMGGLTDSKDSGATNGLPLLPDFLRSKSADISTVEILLILQVTKL